MKQVRIKDICTKGSSSLKQKEVEGRNGLYPVYGASGLIGYIDHYDQEKPYIALVKDGSIGKLMRLPAKSSCIGTIQYIYPNSSINIDYLFYCLSTINFQKYKKGASIPHIYFKDYSEEIINIEEDIKKQQAIVAKLDTLFEKIEHIKRNAESAISDASALFYACLSNKLTPQDDWNYYLLKEVADDFSRGKSRHRPRNDESLFGGDYPFIQTGEIRNSHKYILQHTSTYNEKGLSQSKLWGPGTICITIAANIAETAILTYPCCFPDSVIGFRANNKKANTDFVFFTLLNYKSVLQSLSKGAAQGNINLGTFEKQRFPFPILERQVKIAEELDVAYNIYSKIIKVNNAIINECGSLLHSILNKEF